MSDTKIYYHAYFDRYLVWREERKEDPSCNDAWKLFKKVYETAIKIFVFIITVTYRSLMSCSTCGNTKNYPFLCEESTPTDRNKFYEKSLNLYQSKNTRNDRVEAFIEENKKAVDKIVNVSLATGISSGAALGGAIGAAGGPVGVLIGAVVGIAIGGPVGVGVGASTMKQDYIDWKRKARTNGFLKDLIKFHKDHKELEQFICPISGDIFEEPMVTPYGDNYERKHIYEWIKRSEAQIAQTNSKDYSITDPQRKGRLKIEDIKINYGLLARMSAVYDRLILDDVRTQKIPKHIKKGLVAIHKDLARRIRKHIEFMQHDHAKDLQDGKITRKQYLANGMESLRIFAELDEFLNPV